MDHLAGMPAALASGRLAALHGPAPAEPPAPARPSLLASLSCALPRPRGAARGVLLSAVIDDLRLRPLPVRDDWTFVRKVSAAASTAPTLAALFAAPQPPGAADKPGRTCAPWAATARGRRVPDGEGEGGGQGRGGGAPRAGAPPRTPEQTAAARKAARGLFARERGGSDGEEGECEERWSAAGAAQGYGLRLSAWEPGGLAKAMNGLARVRAAVKIEAVRPGGAAARAQPALARGDILRAVDGAPVAGLAEAKALLQARAPPRGSMSCCDEMIRCVSEGAN
jgi:hypothetical protein